MASRGTKISDAEVKTTLTGTEKFPISDGSGSAKAVTANTIKTFVGAGGGDGKVKDVKVDGTSVLNESTGIASIDLTGKVDKQTGKSLSTNDYDDAAKAEVAKISGKVDKVTGKDLSSNDYTDTDKAQVAKVAELELKTSRISTEEIETEDDAVSITTDEGVEVVKISDTGVGVVGSLKVNGNEVLTSSNNSGNDYIPYGKRRIGCVKYQPIIAGAINHIVEYGQSLSLGGNSVAISTTPEDGCYMLGTSVNDYSYNGTELSPLKNKDGNDDAEDITTGEDMVVPTINALKYLCLQSRVDAEFLGSSSGNGGMIIDKLSKVSQSGAHIYDRFLAHIAHAKSAADANNKPIVCPAIMYLQGESEYGTDEYSAGALVPQDNYTEEGLRPAIDYYKGKLIQLKNDMQADIMSKYGQSLKPLFYVHEVGSMTSPKRGAVVNMAQIEACEENDDMILVGAPTFAPKTDVHLNGNGYRWWAEFFAKVIFETNLFNYKFEPLKPIKFKAIGNKIYITHKVPCPPLVIDEHTVGVTNCYGYKFYSTPNRNTITGVEVNGCDVILTCAKEVSGTYEITYAFSGGTGGNSRGNICDSDRWLSLTKYVDDSVDTLAPSSAGELNYRPKDKEGNYIFGQNYPMQNWCIPYYYIINF